MSWRHARGHLTPPGISWKYPERVKIAQNLVGYARKWLGDIGLNKSTRSGDNPIEQEVPYTNIFGMAGLARLRSRWQPKKKIIFIGNIWQSHSLPVIHVMWPGLCRFSMSLRRFQLKNKEFCWYLQWNKWLKLKGIILSYMFDWRVPVPMKTTNTIPSYIGLFILQNLSRMLHNTSCPLFHNKLAKSAIALPHPLFTHWIY